jgi:hypothetical protein
MLETRSIVSTCEKCQQENSIALKYFAGFDNMFEKSVVATCQSCNTDFIATLDESMIR